MSWRRSFGRPGPAIFAVLDHDDAIGHFQRQLDVLFGDEHRKARAAQAGNAVLDDIEHRRGKTLARLVQSRAASDSS